MSPKASDAPPRAGFLLVEVLVALVVAGLLLGVIGRAFAVAWGATRMPMEIMSAVTVARTVAAATGKDAIGAEGHIGGFAFARSSDPVTIVPRPSRLAPAPPTAAFSSQAPKPPAVESSSAAADAAGAPPLRLRRFSVVVRTPSGRHVSLETIRLDAAPN